MKTVSGRAFARIVERYGWSLRAAAFVRPLASSESFERGRQAFRFGELFEAGTAQTALVAAAEIRSRCLAQGKFRAPTSLEV